MSGSQTILLSLQTNTHMLKKKWDKHYCPFAFIGFRSHSCISGVTGGTQCSKNFWVNLFLPCSPIKPNQLIKQKQRRKEESTARFKHGQNRKEKTGLT